MNHRTDLRQNPRPEILTERRTGLPINRSRHTPTMAKDPDFISIFPHIGSVGCEQ